MKRTKTRDDGTEIKVWDEMVYRAEVDLGVDGQYLTSYHYEEADAIAEAEAWLDAPRLPSDLARIAEMLEATALELRAARLHDGEISDEQRDVLLREAGKNVVLIGGKITEQLGGEPLYDRWTPIMVALKNLYAARRAKTDKDYHVDVLMEAFEAWLG